MHYQRKAKGSQLDAPVRGYSTGSRRRGYAALASSNLTGSSAHVRVRRTWGPASLYQCVTCSLAAYDWAYDGTDPTHLYEFSRKSWTHFSRWPEFYMPMCRRCHVGRDRRIAAEELREYREWKLQNPGKTLADLAIA